jgi:hypothetical protein
MRKGHIFALVSVLLCSAAGVAFAVRPSGPGQTTSSASLSVAIASDQSRVRFDESPRVAAEVTPSDTADASAACNGSVFAGVPDAGTLTMYPCESDASVTFNGLGSGARIPGCFKRIMATGTTVSGIVCQGY